MNWISSLSARARLLLMAVVSAAVLLFSLLLRAGNQPDSTTLTSSTVLQSADSATRAEVLKLVETLQPLSSAGFAPEVYQAINDPRQILPPDATVVPVEESLLIDGDRAMMDAVVKAPGVADAAYWLFLERRDEVWVITGTIGLPQ